MSCFHVRYVCKLKVLVLRKTFDPENLQQDLQFSLCLIHVVTKETNIEYNSKRRCLPSTFLCRGRLVSLKALVL